MGDLLTFPTRADRQVSKRELARLWNCSPRTIERHVHAGLPSEMIEGVRYFWFQAACQWRTEQEERCHVGAAAAAQ